MITDTTLNAAFIGCGAIAQKKHLPLSFEDPSIHIKALFDVNRDAAQRCRREFGADDTLLADSAEDIFLRTDIDLVFISTPNNTHAAYSIAALNSGKHVVCEKPMAISAADAQEMLDASRRNARYLHIS
ncbi:MAG: Gfo/Idh/MocA family oxidoreductase, partial [Clostridiales bacterium]|nr:Gfo/Idh/MocA family oxidoreductase [Clostridiales bacterium]